MSEPDRSLGSSRASERRFAPDLEWLTHIDEAVRWRGGPRVQSAYPWIGVGAAGLLVAGLAIGLEIVPLVVALIGIPAVVVALWGYLSVARTVFLVTTDACYARRGVLGVRVTVVGLDRVQNTRTSQSALGRLFDYGTVTIDTAGGHDEELAFWNVTNPQRVRSVIDSAVDRSRERDDVPGSVETWEEILDDVRRWRRTLERSS